MTIFTDGASRGNPGQAASGFMIQTDDGVIWFEGGGYLGVATNNVAEYSAVKLAFEKLLNNFSSWMPVEVSVKADSKLIVEQLSGRFKIKNPALRIIYDEIKAMERKIGKVKYFHIPRSQNYLADRLANKALDERSA